MLVVKWTVFWHTMYSLQHTHGAGSTVITRLQAPVSVHIFHYLDFPVYTESCQVSLSNWHDLIPFLVGNYRSLPPNNYSEFLLFTFQHDTLSFYILFLTLGKKRHLTWQDLGVGKYCFLCNYLKPVHFCQSLMRNQTLEPPGAIFQIMKCAVNRQFCAAWFVFKGPVCLTKQAK